MMHRSAKNWFHVMKKNACWLAFWLDIHLCLVLNNPPFGLKTIAGNVCFYTLCSNTELCQWHIQHARDGTFWNTCCASKSLGRFQRSPHHHPFSLTPVHTTQLLEEQARIQGSHPDSHSKPCTQAVSPLSACEVHQDKSWIIISS